MYYTEYELFKLIFRDLKLKFFIQVSCKINIDTILDNLLFIDWMDNTVGVRLLVTMSLNKQPYKFGYNKQQPVCWIFKLCFISRQRSCGQRLAAAFSYISWVSNFQCE